MDRRTYTTYEPVSLTAAPPGWRAAYIHPPDEGEPGWSADPLIAWAVWEVTERPVQGSTAPEKARGREIHGVIYDGWVQAVPETANFWKYLAPGDPDPSPGEVAAGQERLSKPGRTA